MIVINLFVRELNKMVLERKKVPPLGELEPPTFRLTSERASQLRHRNLIYFMINYSLEERKNKNKNIFP
jgi:hypothetical protein